MESHYPFILDIRHQNYRNTSEISSVLSIRYQRKVKKIKTWSERVTVMLVTLWRWPIWNVGGRIIIFAIFSLCWWFFQSWIGHQYFKLVTNTFGLRHPSPTSTWPTKSKGFQSIFSTVTEYHLIQQLVIRFYVATVSMWIGQLKWGSQRVNLKYKSCIRNLFITKWHWLI